MSSQQEQQPHLQQQQEQQPVSLSQLSCDVPSSPPIPIPVLTTAVVSLSPSPSSPSPPSAAPVSGLSCSLPSPDHDSSPSCSSPSCSSLVSSAVDSSSVAHRHYARKALLAVGDKASRLISQTRASHPVMRFSLDTVSALVPGSAKSFTVNQWSYYGDPLLNKLDAKLDEAVTAINNATSGLQQVYEYTTYVPPPPSLPPPPSSASSSVPPADSSESDLAVIPVPLDRHDKGLYQLYWERLKDKFIHSHWYVKVDAILLQNSLVHAVTHKMVRPAEVFFNTVTEEFLSHGKQDEFLSALQSRVGPAWDDRLAPLAKGFYTTAKAVSALVGAGKFVGGALQLGKCKVHNVIDELMEKWDRVLGLGDQMMDRWLPEVEQEQRQRLLAAGANQDNNATSGSPLPLPLPLQQQQQSLCMSSSAFCHPHLCNRNWLTEEQRKIDATNHGLLFHHDQTYNSEDDDLTEESQSHVYDDDDDDDELEALDLPENVSCSPGVRFKVNCKKRNGDHLTDSHYDDNFSSMQNNIHAHAATASSTLYSVDSALSVPSDLSLSHTDRSGQVLISKFGKRLRQRMPSMSMSAMTGLPAINAASLAAFTTDLKQRLMESSWFTSVDEILMQNALVKALAAIVRPAEHFFNTSLQLFTTKNRLITQPQQTKATVALPLQGHTSSSSNNDSNMDSMSMSMSMSVDVDGEEHDTVSSSVMTEEEFSSEGVDTSMTPGAVVEEEQKQQASTAIIVLASTSAVTVTHPASLISSSAVLHSSNTFVPLLSPSVTSRLDSTPAASGGGSSSLFPSSSSPSCSVSIPCSPFLPGAFPPPSPLSVSSCYQSDAVIDDFVLSLRAQLGGSWDDRLYQPARNFYETAAHSAAMTQIPHRSSAGA